MDWAEHLKRFRGAALALIVVQGLVLAGGAEQFASGQSEAGQNLLAGALLVLIPAIMVWNGSIFGGAALVMLLTADLILNIQQSEGIGWPIIRGCLYVAASLWIFRELFLYRRKIRTVEKPLGGSGFVRWTGSFLVVGFGALTAFGLMLETDTNPAPQNLLTARQIPGDQYQWMYDNNILGRDERVFLYAGDHDTPYSDGGNLLTTRYVGSWWREDGELDSGWIKLGEICSVEKTPTDDDVNGTLYTIHTFGGDSWLRILLPKSGREDREFLARMNYLNNQKMHREVRSACDEKREPDWDRIAASNGISRQLVQPEDMKPEHLTWLRHNEFLTHGEKVLKFYSYGNYAIDTGGLLLTDTHFGGWSEDSDGLQGWRFKFGEICTINKENETGETEDPKYRVESVDNWFQFQLPAKDGQSLALIEQIKDMNEAARSEDEEEACKAMLKEKIEAAKKDLGDILD